VFNATKTGSTSNNVVAVPAEAEQPSHSLPVEKPPSTSTTTTTTTTTTTSTTPDYQTELELNTPSRLRPSLSDRHPAAVSFDFATRQRPRPSTSSATPPPRRRWPSRRGRYPPTRHRYGRRPPYRSATDCQAVSTFLTVLTVLVAMNV